METAELLEAARGGDERAFERLVEPHRRELHQHCYRMLGSVHDADDAVQESLLRAWKAIGRFDGRQPVRPWLYRIATNRCLTSLETRRRRELPTDLSPDALPGAEVEWLEPYPDARLGLDALGPEARVVARERVELAFVAALQRLSPLQRAVLLLREVLEFPAREVAELLETSVPAVNSALQRARAVVEARTPARSQQRELADLGPEVRAVVERYAAAWEAADVDALVAMLAEDVRLEMPPTPEWYEGPAAVRAALLAGPITYRWRMVPTWANGQLTVAGYRWDESRGLYVGEGVDLLTLRDGRITAITAFLVDDLGEFGVPRTMS
ncbi:sigma-70 family RNA polymerase sigma factor [Phytohabitans flavus]|uniref:RNA polymerase sigma factor n=1 Tax=Phytohabitans flavus TaxID=1076124 RepID=A0A6F8XR07_9ACTN|nr:sigma-70 family RNA polymerase sigma factor [Phytohabitans flavus]BCB76188.1 RNA polymerase sigma factor [Phytohabitans flavus]